MSLSLSLFLSSYLHSADLTEAARYHRDFQTAGEGIVIAGVDTGGPRYDAAGFLGEGGEAVGPDTIFEIGSITKVFTGILLADAVLSGKAALEDPVSRHLPADLLGAESPLRSITLLELSTHTSGLPRLPPDLDRGADPADPYAHYSVDRLLETLPSITADQIKDRGKTSYSNFGVGLLGHLLERISGKPYEVLLREVILDPLGMSSTYLSRPGVVLPGEAKARLATGHSGGKPVSHWRIDALCGAGAILSTASDLARFAEAQWSGEAPARLAAAMNLAAARHSGDVGLGWFIQGQGTLVHDGGTGGFRSELRVNLPDKSATIRLMNSAGPTGAGELTGDFSDLSGYWSGPLKIGDITLRQVLRVSDAGRVVLHSVDQGGTGLPVGGGSLEGNELRLVFPSVGGSLSGRIEDDRIVGEWNQNGAFPLTLTRRAEVPEELVAALKKRFSGDLTRLQGWWSGYLGGEAGLFVVLEVEGIGTSGEARFYSPDQTEEPLRVAKLSFDGGELAFSLGDIAASYEGALGKDGKLSGVWKQGPIPLPLVLTPSDSRPEREP